MSPLLYPLKDSLHSQLKKLTSQLEQETVMKSIYSTFVKLSMQSQEHGRSSFPKKPSSIKKNIIRSVIFSYRDLRVGACASSLTYIGETCTTLYNQMLLNHL